VDVTNVLIFGAPALTLVITCVAMARKLGMPTKYAPALAVSLGLTSGVVIGVTQAAVGIGTGIVSGVFIGASAMGIYDAGKVTSTSEK
jgi:hypothetical protein